MTSPSGFPVHPRTVAAMVLVAGACLLAGPSVAADEGWQIDRLDLTYDLRPDGTLDARETIDADFRNLPHHGIVRDLAHLQTFDSRHLREYRVAIGSVTDPDGRPYRVSTSVGNGLYRVRIGDPDRTVVGAHSYRLAYTLTGALNGFADHDELYWNATGTWQIAVAHASVVVRAPGGIERVDCFQGRAGSVEKCAAQFSPEQASFTATRPLPAGEQLTIVVGLRKGVVNEPQPILVSGPRSLVEFFQGFRTFLLAAVGGLLVAVAGMGTVWWRFGRDKRYVSVQYLAGEGHGAEERVPLFGARPIAVEFEPPEGIRPGQLGLLLDERADTLDVTATIIDLAARGYLTITELPKTWWFGRPDWRLDRVDKSREGLIEYERIILDGLFDSGPSPRLSDLKRKFYKHLAKAQKALYADAVERGWFPHNPSTVRTVWRLAGVALVGGGVPLAIVLGARWGAAFLGLPLIASGIVLVLSAGAMPRRTAKGHELLHRALGFVRYVKTAEVHQQDFAERAHIFTTCLPYAIVFRCVHKWADAFKDIDLNEATASWYVGGSAFDADEFSSKLSGFSSSVSTAIASTPGGSGGSGFGGGSAGGGGGGGGGGGW